MSWLGATPVAKISPKNAFYFLNEKRIENGIFRLSGQNSVIVNNPEIKDLPETGKATAVPKDVIDKLQPAKHFLVRVKLSVGRNTQNFGEIPLGEILTDLVWKYHNNPKFLTRALVSAGEPCLDLGDSIVILSCGKIFPKFSDDEIWEKLNKTLNETFLAFDHYILPKFSIEVPREKKSTGEHISVEVYISLCKEIRDIMTGKYVGTFVVPKKDEDHKKCDE